MTGHNETRTCACGTKFKPKREGKHHCCSACRVKQAIAHYRRSDNRSDDTLTRIPEQGERDGGAKGAPPSYSQIVRLDTTTIRSDGNTSVHPKVGAWKAYHR